jgi:hypothetical protein
MGFELPPQQIQETVNLSLRDDKNSFEAIAFSSVYIVCDRSESDPNQLLVTIHNKRPNDIWIEVGDSVYQINGTKKNIEKNQPLFKVFNLPQIKVGNRHI